MERERQREMPRCTKKNDTFWNTKDRVWVMERSESGEEETFRVDCADEEA
jgi:hypothetical protein